MSFLPIVERELRLAARRPTTYRNRVLAAGAMALVAAGMLVSNPFPITSAPAYGDMFRVLSWMLLVYCLLAGVRKTADCLSQERREGTLGLLFLTDLRGYDVVLGKLAAGSLPSVFGLFALLPILALALVLGGVTPGEYWRMALALYNALFFSLAAGLLVSSLCREERQAMGLTAALLLVTVGLPAVMPPGFWTGFSPWQPFTLAFETNYQSAGAGGYSRSWVASQGLAWLFLAIAGWVVIRFRQGGDTERSRPSDWWGRRLGRRLGSPQKRAERRMRWLAIHPINWLVRREQGPGVLLWLLTAGMIVDTVAMDRGVARAPAYRAPDYFWNFIWFGWIVNLVVKMRIGALACHLFARGRAEGTLELLLCTPLKFHDLVQGQIVALHRSVAVPLTVLFAVEAFGAVTMSTAVYRVHFFECVVAGAVYTLVCALELRALIWVGMWFGLSSGRESLAVCKNLGVVLWLSMLPFLNEGFFLIYPLAAFFWLIIAQLIAQQKLQYNFRRLAGQRNLVPAGAGGGRWRWQRTYLRLPPLLADSGPVMEGRLEEPQVFGTPAPPGPRRSKPPQL